MPSLLWPWLFLWSFQLCRAELAIGIFADPWEKAVLLAEAIVEYGGMGSYFPGCFGSPIIQIAALHPEVANVTLRMGTSHGRPDTGIATALDFMLGNLAVIESPFSEDASG
eukprot:s214_g18.t1